MNLNLHGVQKVTLVRFELKTERDLRWTEVTIVSEDGGAPRSDTITLFHGAEDIVFDLARIDDRTPEPVK